MYRWNAQDLIHLKSKYSNELHVSHVNYDVKGIDRLKSTKGWGQS